MPEEYPYFNKNTNMCIKDCNINDFLNSDCSTDNENDESIENNLDKIKDAISEHLIDDLLDDILEGGEDKTINEKNTKYQLSSSSNQNNNEYKDISNIKLGECEKKLKEVYKNISANDSLLIFKVDFNVDSLSAPLVEYELYHPKTKEKLDLQYCQDFFIDISKPSSVNENNLFKYDPNNEYYKDICSTFTTDDDTDITIKDRINEFINNNLSLCENGCNLHIFFV